MNTSVGSEGERARKVRVSDDLPSADLTDRRFERLSKRRTSKLTAFAEQRFISVVLGVLLGFAIWCGVQYFSERDNFDSTIHATYFLVLYATGYSLGLIRKGHPFVASFAMVASQPVAYLIYPNAKGELGNLFPIAAAMLFACGLPTVGLTYFATLLRRAIARKSTAR